MQLIFFFFIIIPSAIMHEYAHAWMADYLGDSTPRYAGRLTLNPLAHVDLFGTIIMPLLLFLGSGGSFLFAYAKPVPFNPHNLRQRKYGASLVGIAGPAANFLIAAVLGTLVRFLPASPFVLLLGIIVYANILLAVFNLVPVPPLDGSKILFEILPPSWDRLKMFLERYGFIILLFFIFFAFSLLSPVVSFVFRLLTGQPLAYFL